MITAIFFSYEPRKKVGKGFGFVFFLLHYLSMCIVMMFIGISFGWFEASLAGVLEMAVSVGLVYIFTVVISLALHRGEAQKMNDALKKYADDNDPDRENGD